MQLRMSRTATDRLGSDCHSPSHATSGQCRCLHIDVRCRVALHICLERGKIVDSSNTSAEPASMCAGIIAALADGRKPLQRRTITPAQQERRAVHHDICLLHNIEHVLLGT